MKAKVVLIVVALLALIGLTSDFGELFGFSNRS